MLKPLFLLSFITLSLTVTSQQIDKVFEIKPYATEIATSKNNEDVAITSPKSIFIFDRKTGEQKSEIPFSKATNIDISNAKLLASSTNEIAIWDLTNGSKINSFSPHVKSIIKASFINGNQIASLGKDGKILISEITGQKIREINVSSIKTTGEIESSLSSTIIIISDGNTLFSYDSQTGELKSKIAIGGKKVRTFAISPNGKLVAAGIDDRSVHVWNIKDGTKIAYFEKAAKDYFYSSSFSHDSKRVAFGSGDHTISIVELCNLTKPEINVLNKGQYKITDLAFSQDNNEILKVQEFNKTVELITSPISVTTPITLKNGNDDMGPQIYVSNLVRSSTGNVNTEESLYLIKGRIIDEQGVNKVTVNGNIVPIEASGEFQMYLPLAIGKNPVEIKAVDVNQNHSRKAFAVIRKDPNALVYNPATAKSYLLIIGINEYETWHDLNNAVSDATSIKTTLNKNYKFEEENIVFIKNTNASKENIQTKLRDLVKKVTPADNVMIYYSGHGYYDEVLNEGYIVPSNARTKTADYISNSTLLKFIENINSQHTLLILDACFSGSLFSNVQRGYMERVEQFRSRRAITSGRLETVSDGDITSSNSPFTTLLIKYFNESTKGKVMVSSLEQYIKENFPENQSQTPRSGALKGVGDEGGEFIFYKR